VKVTVAKKLKSIELVFSAPRRT